jgi:hypothetical protein
MSTIYVTYRAHADFINIIQYGLCGFHVNNIIINIARNKQREILAKLWVKLLHQRGVVVVAVESAQHGRLTLDDIRGNVKWFTDPLDLKSSVIRCTVRPNLTSILSIDPMLYNLKCNIFLLYCMVCSYPLDEWPFRPTIND